MFLRFFLLMVVVSILTTSEALSFESSKLYLQSNDHRFSRSLRIHKTTDITSTEDEERTPPTMKYAGIFRNEQETKSWLQSWFNNKVSVKSVAAKLGMSDDALKYFNSGALAKYQKMIQNSENGVKYARFGEDFSWVSKQKMQNLLGNWALQGKSAEFVTQQLGMSTLTSAQIKTHVNYNALKYFDDMVIHLKKIRAGP